MVLPLHFHVLICHLIISNVDANTATYTRTHAVARAPMGRGVEMRQSRWRRWFIRRWRHGHQRVQLSVLVLLGQCAFAILLNYFASAIHQFISFMLMVKSCPIVCLQAMYTVSSVGYGSITMETDLFRGK